jgi:predicted DNA-binding ribbon-helix-helix protein
MRAPRLFANVARTGTTTLSVMLLGVALVCLVWLLLGLAAARELSTVEARVAESQRQALRSATLASTIRVQVVLASVTLRDLLLETDPDVAREHVGQIDEAHASATWAITEFGRLA